VADWIMSFTWGLVVGTASPIPYFYSVFFITVLIHRTTRDFERCVSITSLCLNVNC
jgi:delta24(24(1))-sterol reductase